MIRLERQIVSTALARYRFLCRWERISGGPCWWEGGCHRSARSANRSTCYGHLSAHNVVGTNLVKPTSIVLVSINIERDGHVFVHLNVKLLDAVFTENAEDALTGILSGHLDDIFLRHPRITRTG